MLLWGALVLLMGLIAAADGGPLQASKDLVWPLPLQMNTATHSDSSLVAEVAPGFSFDCPGGSDVLSAAAARYADLIDQGRPCSSKKFGSAKAKSNKKGERNSIVRETGCLDAADSFIFEQQRQKVQGAVPIHSAKVAVEDLNADLQLGVDESYGISVSASGNVVMNATTVWGALHAMELFTQLVQHNSERGGSFVADLPLSVQNTPRFPHRGLLLDSARHFQPVSVIKRAIDGLAQNHMNVLHWHAVDAESFPVVSPSAPKLSDGAYAPQARYTMDQIKDVVSYARARGVRVVMEFDVPGHADSWRVGYPGIVAKCPDWSGNINNVPLNPAVDEAWTVISGLMNDIASAVNDDFIHIGGDEVVYACWKEDPILQAWMSSHDFSNLNQVMQYFENRLWSILEARNKTMIAWEEIFNGYELQNLPKSLIIEVWKDEPTLLDVANAKQRGILAYGWYLDHLQLDWKAFYTHEPFTESSWNALNEAYVVGGEACAWGEQIDQYNFDARVFPRTSATAERLWSPKSATDIDYAQTRLVNQICRMNARGIASAPIVPNFCPY